MEVVGVDPGLSGAVASWNGTQLCTVEVPSFKAAARGLEVDWASLYFDVDIQFSTADHVFIERVGSMPGQGVASTFKFGYVAGGFRGMFTAMGRPITLVTPQKWKKALSVGASKDSSVARATQLFPSYAPIFRGPRGGLKDGVAEAALIAYYGFMELDRR
jgi:crossover junction endodeoxyribonuclease RuvC